MAKERKMTVETDGQYAWIKTWVGDERPIVLQVKADDEGFVVDATLSGLGILAPVFHETYEEIRERVNAELVEVIR